MVRLALKNKRAIYAGEGTNIWPHVHVKDVSDMTVRCIDHNLEATMPAGFERFCLQVSLLVYSVYLATMNTPADYSRQSSAENGEH